MVIGTIHKQEYKLAQTLVNTAAQRRAPHGSKQVAGKAQVHLPLPQGQAWPLELLVELEPGAAPGASHPQQQAEPLEPQCPCWPSASSPEAPQEQQYCSSCKWAQLAAAAWMAVVPLCTTYTCLCLCVHSSAVVMSAGRSLNRELVKGCVPERWKASQECSARSSVRCGYDRQRNS